GGCQYWKLSGVGAPGRRRPGAPMGSPSARRLGQAPLAPARHQRVQDVRAPLVVARHRDGPLLGDAVVAAAEALDVLAVFVGVASDRDALALDLPGHLVPVRAAPLAHRWPPLATDGISDIANVADWVGDVNIERRLVLGPQADAAPDPHRGASRLGARCRLARAARSAAASTPAAGRPCRSRTPRYRR